MCGKYFLVITARDVEYCKNINENGYSCAKLASIEKYKDIFKRIFEVTNHQAHYEMMMGISSM